MKTDYARIKRKVFLQMVVLLASSAIAVFLLYQFLQGKLGLWTISLISLVTGANDEQALAAYTAIFRDHWGEFMLLAMGIVFLGLFHFSLNWFGRYFNLINRGIQALLNPQHEAILLSPELKSVEENLQTVQRTLEQQRAEAALAEQKKDDLIMYLAHDIKTPLTSIIGYLTILDETKEMAEEQRERCVRISLDKANRLEKLVQEFFEITRLHRQEQVLVKREIDLHYLMIQLVEECYPHMEARSMKARIDIRSAINVLGDADYLARALQNLLRNAITYGDKNSLIRIGGGLQGDQAVLTVTNTGDTLSLEEQTQLFEPFYRADDARQAHTGGSGLGLAIAKHSISLQGGSIHVTSAQRTTTFTVSLPAVPSEGDKRFSQSPLES